MHSSPLALSDILYEDNHLIAVNKKPSEIVQGDKTGDTPLSGLVEDYIRKKYNKPGNVFVGTAHRLDRPVSGIVLFAKTGKALGRLNEMFRTRAISKTYWAVVKQKPEHSRSVLVHYLRKNEARNKSQAFEKEQPGTLKSELEYRLLASLTNYHLIEVKPLTGRHHQIRAQLAAIGCPIKGDVKYGFARTNTDASIHLHARSVEFIHPVKQEPLRIVAAPPQDVLWNEFLKQVG